MSVFSTDIQKLKPSLTRHFCLLITGVAQMAKVELYEYCKTPSDYAPGFFEDDHIIPKSKNGTSTLDNLALVCDGCNNAKAAKTEGIDPVSNRPVPLFHPRKDKWAEHFTWSNNSLIITGISPAERATVEALQLNRTPLVNLRSALFLAGVHPPADEPGRAE
ncbi:MAG: HNH endonuclease [Saprospiraceae bacterium]|nr:MAG: HNH endonuclease [Saprospiraceae bacterium]